MGLPPAFNSSGHHSNIFVFLKPLSGFQKPKVNFQMTDRINKLFSAYYELPYLIAGLTSHPGTRCGPAITGVAFFCGGGTQRNESDSDIQPF
jgi:hypothetical protein